MSVSAPPFLARGRLSLRVNNDSRFSPKASQQNLQIAALQRDTTCCGSERFARDVDEHGAAAAGDPRSHIVVDFDNQVVQPIGAAQKIAWFIGRAAKDPIVAPVGGVLTPGVGRPDWARRQQCTRPRQAVGPPPQPQGMKTAARSGAIALALVGADAATAERNRQGQGAGEQPTPRPPAWTTRDADDSQ
jgi:hypothetical protein